MAIQPNGKILVAANMNDPGAPQITLFRFNANGSPDTSFGSGGSFTIPVAPGSVSNWERTNAMALQPDGKILALNGSSLFRINSNGSMDTSFGGTGWVTSPALHFPSAFRVLSDDKIMIAGEEDRQSPMPGATWYVARYNSERHA